MRHIFILQMVFFLVYGLISGAVFTELKERHKEEIVSLMIRLPLAELANIPVKNI